MKNKIISILKNFEQQDYKSGVFLISPEKYDEIADKINMELIMPEKVAKEHFRKQRDNTIIELNGVSHKADALGVTLGDKNTTTKPIQWVWMKERKPSKDGKYFWKGKNGCAGKDYYDSNSGEFEINNYITPSNWVADEHLYWLDEGDF